MPRIIPTTTFTRRTKTTDTWRTNRGVDYFTLDTTLFTCDTTSFTCDKTIDSLTGGGITTNWEEVRYGSFLQDLTGEIVQDLTGESVIGLTGRDVNGIQTQWN